MIDVAIEGQPITTAEIRAWELSRARAVLASMRRKLGETAAPVPGEGLELIKAQLAQLKAAIADDAVRRLWRSETRASNVMTRAVSALSGRRRRWAKVGIAFAGVGAAAFSEQLDAFMLRETAEIRAINLAACPDHHLLRPNGSVLEVIETTGGSPFASRFFMTFGDESGLALLRDPAYPHQSVGTARLEDGRVVGGVRHQFREDGERLLIKLGVEFPAMTPGWMVRQHQWHLACEFTNWIEAVCLALYGSRKNVL